MDTSQDKSVVNAAKVIVSTAVVVTAAPFIAVIGFIAVLLIIAIPIAIVTHSVADPVGTIFVICVLAYYVVADKQRQAKKSVARIAAIRQQAPAQPTMTKVERVKMIKDNIASLRRCVAANDTPEIRASLAMAEDNLVKAENLTDLAELTHSAVT